MILFSSGYSMESLCESLLDVQSYTTAMTIQI